MSLSLARLSRSLSRALTSLSTLLFTQPHQTMSLHNTAPSPSQCTPSSPVFSPFPSAIAPGKPANSSRTVEQVRCTRQQSKPSRLVPRRRTTRSRMEFQRLGTYSASIPLRLAALADPFPSPPAVVPVRRPGLPKSLHHLLTHIFSTEVH